MQEVRNVRIDGKGQAQPGPSLSILSSVRARSAVVAAVAWLILSLSSAGRFLFETSTVGHLDERAVVGAGAIATGVLLGWVYLPATTRAVEMRRLPSLAAWVTAVAAAVASAGVPLLVFANRYSDAPKGSVVLFWTVVVCGIALWLVGGLEGGKRVSRVSGSVLGMTGAMGVLANWERPSSFSLLSRYAREQLLMGLAAVVWAACVLWLVRRVRDRGWGDVSVPFAIGAMFAGALLVATSPSAGDALAPAALLAASCAAVMMLLTLWIGVEHGVALAGTALVAVPLVVSCMTLLEQATGMRGPRPLLLSEVMWAAAACAAGLSFGFARTFPAASTAQTRPTLPAWAVWPGVGAVALSLAALSADGVAVAIRGVRESGSFSADLTMSGAETVGGWLVLGLALIVILSLWRFSRAFAIKTLIALPMGIGAWVVLRFIPLHTWISWIPAEVQQDYGTEYASIVFGPVALWWQVAALVACAVGALVLAWNLYVGSYVRADRQKSEGPSRDKD